MTKNTATTVFWLLFVYFPPDFLIVDHREVFRSAFTLHPIISVGRFGVVGLWVLRQKLELFASPKFVAVFGLLLGLEVPNVWCSQLSINTFAIHFAIFGFLFTIVLS